MAKHDVQNVSYMRKDTHFLADGTWYISTPCPVHGLVDEEVSWDEAKTPHHAGLIADQRHVECSHQIDAETFRLVAEAEIAAAEDLLRQQELNLAAASKRLTTVKAEARKRESPIGERLLGEAERDVERHKEGLLHARRRVEDTRRHNRPTAQA